MVEASEKALEGLRVAMQMERDGHQFYTQVAATVAYERSRTMFLSLAEDELKHLKTLATNYEGLMRTGEWPRVERKPIGGEARRAVSAIFPTGEQEVRREVGKRTSDVEALRLGLKKEDESFSYYSGAAEQADDPNARTLFQQLAQEEEEHGRILQNYLDYLEDPSNWFRQRERPIFEG